MGLTDFWHRLWHKHTVMAKGEYELLFCRLRFGSSGSVWFWHIDDTEWTNVVSWSLPYLNTLAEGGTVTAVSLQGTSSTTWR